MLSYRHGFHAGNHADVLKHLVQVLILDHMLAKPTAISYLDSHAGAGYFPFSDPFAAKNREYETGIGRLVNCAVLPMPLQRYLDVINGCTKGQPTGYPGSPAIALQLLRSQDRAHLFELHPRDAAALQKRFSPRAKVYQSDGFAGIKALLPPPSRRGVLLMDPPFEVKNDYQRAVESLLDCLKRFASGVYALWYPLLARPESQAMATKLQALLPDSWLYCSLEVAAPAPQGMFGSAMYVINPPWRLACQLEEALPALAELLGEPGAGRWQLKHRPR